MKTLLFLSVLTLSPSLLAEEYCEQTSGNTALEEMMQTNCGIIDAQSSCAENEPDPDALRNQIEAKFAYAEKEKENIQRRWNIFKNTEASQFFREAGGNKPPEPLLDWFTNNGEAEGITKDQVKAALVENYVNFAKKNDCRPVIKHQITHISFPLGLKAKSEQELNRELGKISDLEAQKDEFFKNLNGRALQRGSYCEKRRSIKAGFQYTHIIHPPCAGNVSGFFKDNEWSTSSLDKDLASAGASEVVNCIRDRLKAGATIHHISVSASASALNNSGGAAKRFCRKGFRGLSEARAEAAKNRILPQLFSRAGAGNFDYSSHVRINASGTNGDGTSGPCPYKLVNGVEVLKDEFRTPEGRQELEDAKYVKIQVTFNEHKTPHPDTDTYYENRYFCRNIRFECAPAGSPQK